MSKIWDAIAAKLPFNRRNGKTQATVALIVLLLLLGFATQCHAAERAYMQFGAGSTVARGETEIMTLVVVVPKVIRDADVQAGITLIGESSYQWGSEAMNQPSNFAAHVEIVDGFGKFDVGLGLAYLQNVDSYNGSHVNFSLYIGYRLAKWTIGVRHFSNAGTVRPNIGRDMVFVARQFR